MIIITTYLNKHPKNYCLMEKWPENRMFYYFILDIFIRFFKFQNNKQPFGKKYPFPLQKV